MTVFELVFYILVELSLGAMMGVINLIFLVFAIILFYFGETYLSSPTLAVGSMDNAAIGAIFITFGASISMMILLSSTGTLAGIGYFTFLVIDGFMASNDQATAEDLVPNIEFSNDFGTLFLEALMLFAILPYIAIALQLIYFIIVQMLIFYAVFNSMVGILWFVDYVLRASDPDADLIFTKVYYSRLVEVPDPPPSSIIIFKDGSAGNMDFKNDKSEPDPQP